MKCTRKPLNIPLYPEEGKSKEFVLVLEGNKDSRETIDTEWLLVGTDIRLLNWAQSLVRDVLGIVIVFAAKVFNLGGVVVGREYESKNDKGSDRLDFLQSNSVGPGGIGI